VKCAYALDSGVYVLGALSPAELEIFERHLRTCAHCRQEVAELAVLPDLLGQVDSATAKAITREPTAPPRSAEPTPVLERTRPRRPATYDVLRPYGRARGRTRSVVPLVAACLAIALGIAVAAGIGIGRFVGEDSPARSGLVAMSPVADAVPVSAELAVRPRAGGGSTVVMSCRYTATGGVRWTLSLFVVSRSGTAQEVGRWTADRGDQLQMTVDTPLSPGDIDRLEVRSAAGAPLLVRRL
jgi:hypothetical protein